MLTKPQSFYDNIHKQALGYQNPFYLKKAQWIKPTLYDGCVISEKHDVIPVVDDEETLILEEVSRLKMFEKAKDPEAIKQNISHKPIDYEKLNRLTEDFGKCFSPQQELSAKQAFWFRIVKPSIEPSYTPPVIVDVPSELPKNSGVAGICSSTCPNAITPSAKKVTVKPMNNVKKVRFAEPFTSSSKIQPVESSVQSDSNPDTVVVST
ncbi:hypothetical protein Tco_0602479 [Tanacetum coccineum]